MLAVREKLDRAHELLRRAQQGPEEERLWLLTLAWAQLHEAASAMESSREVPPRTAYPEAKVASGR